MKSQAVSVLLLVGLLFICKYTAQAQVLDSVYVLPCCGDDTLDVVFFTESDTLPKEMYISGYVLETTTFAICGMINSSGTMKIKLLTTSKAFPDSFIYVVVNCLYFWDSLIGHKVSLEVKALFPANKEINSLMLNRFHSKGIPFYWIDNKQRSELLKSIGKDD